MKLTTVATIICIMHNYCYKVWKQSQVFCTPCYNCKSPTILPRVKENLLLNKVTNSSVGDGEHALWVGSISLYQGGFSLGTQQTHKQMRIKE